MKTLDSGKDKVQQICNAIRREALEPAEREKQRLLEEGEKERQALIDEGKRERERIVDEGRRTIEQERNVFDSAMTQATKQAIETCKQQIEALLRRDLDVLVDGPTADPAFVASLLKAFVVAFDREGFGANLSATVARNVDAEAVSKLLAKDILDRLEGKTISVGDFGGGGLHLTSRDHKMTVELTGDDVKKLLAHHLRKDFRALLFADGV